MKKEPYKYKYLAFLYSVSFVCMLGYFEYVYYTWYSVTGSIFQSSACTSALKSQVEAAI